ncbi:hypothetical protein Plhal304r1_c025g0085081 [Plasmopara halstedii]
MNNVLSICQDVRVSIAIKDYSWHSSIKPIIVCLLHQEELQVVVPTSFKFFFFSLIAFFKSSTVSLSSICTEDRLQSSRRSSSPGC